MSRYGFQIGQGMFMASNFATMTVTGAAQSLSGYGAQIVRALITVEGSAARYNYDGSVPTTSIGHMVNSGDVIQILGVNNLNNFQIVSRGTTTLMITYETGARV